MNEQKRWGSEVSDRATSRAAERYEPFPRAVLERAIVERWKGRRWSVYAALRLASGGTWKQRVRTERLAELTGLDAGNVRRELAALQRSGIVRRQDKQNGPGRWDFAGVDFDAPRAPTKRVTGDAYADPQNASLATRPPLSDKRSISDPSLLGSVPDPAPTTTTRTEPEWTEGLIKAIRHTWRRAGEGPDYTPERIRRALDQQHRAALEAGLRAPTPTELVEYHKRRSVDPSITAGNARSLIAVATTPHRWIEWLRNRITWQARRTG